MSLFLIYLLVVTTDGSQNHFLSIDRDFILESVENAEFCPEGRFYYNKNINRFFLGARFSFSLDANKVKGEKNSMGCEEVVETSNSLHRLMKKTILSNCPVEKIDKKIKTESFEFDPVKLKYYFETNDFMGKKVKCIYK
jgi:hypothetical protein